MLYGWRLHTVPPPLNQHIQFTALSKCWTLNMNKQHCICLIAKRVSCSPPHRPPALISIQFECWERQQWWGQCRRMGSILRTARQHALYVSLHTVGNLLHGEVKWRWMPIVDLPDCLLENTKRGPRQWRSAPFYLFEEAIQEFNPQNIISLPFSYKQNGRHSSLKKKKKEIQFCSVGLGLAGDNPNPLLERW